MAKDYYEILGIQKGASASEIKKAYRKLSRELHPDKHKGSKEKEQKFQAVNEAYEVLGDEKKRAQYDQFGEAGVGGGAGGGQGGFDFSQGFGNFGGGGLGDMFESFFGGGGQRRGPRDERGHDMEVRLSIEFADAVKGITKKIAIEKFASCEECKGSGVASGSEMITCEECGGTGQVTRSAQSFFGTIRQNFVCPKCAGSGKTPKEPCKQCDGEGRKRERPTITVEIPPGIHDGQSLRLTGKGNAGKQGAATGDLYVLITVHPDQRFTREGDDIHAVVTLSVLDVILGTEPKVPTVHGNVSFKIPAGTQPNQVLRIKGKGMPVVGSARHGDHYVHVEVEIPKKLSRKEKELLEQWRELG